MIRRSTLRSQIATALRDEILAGRLATGRQFTVKEIAEQYGVSATPVREALLDLAAQGLLDVEQHRGFRVREYTRGDYVAMCEARRLVVDGVLHEGAYSLGGGQDAGGQEAGRHDAGRHDAGGRGQGSGGQEQGIGGQGTGGQGSGRRGGEHLASVRRRADAAERAARAGDLDVHIAYDLRFWRELGILVSNPYLGDFLDRLRVQCWVHVVPRLRARASLRGHLWAGHTTLLDALEHRDRQAAREVVAGYNAHALALVGTEGPAGAGGADGTGDPGAADGAERDA